MFESKLRSAKDPTLSFVMVVASVVVVEDRHVVEVMCASKLLDGSDLAMVHT